LLQTDLALVGVVYSWFQHI